MFKWKTFVAVSVVTLLVLIPLKLSQWSNRLSYVPSGLSVERILYAHEDSYGYGPGGAEAEFVMYELPEDVAKNIEVNGIRFLNQMPQAMDPTGRRRLENYENWQSTPIKADPKWASSDSVDRNTSFSLDPKIANYLGNYFGFSIDDGIEQEVDKVVSSTGSFFAYGRYGVLIVSPQTRRVFFAHNG